MRDPSGDFTLRAEPEGLHVEPRVEGSLFLASWIDEAGEDHLVLIDRPVMLPGLSPDGVSIYHVLPTYCDLKSIECGSCFTGRGEPSCISPPPPRCPPFCRP
ncbi:hypothetical protein ABI59_09320 [Acidobacteria bacterium Mor1]|nr:hypothetical protein ABI59_09320 [Acidobacteria bacterium Mor1]